MSQAFKHQVLNPSKLPNPQLLHAFKTPDLQASKRPLPSAVASASVRFCPLLLQLPSASVCFNFSCGFSRSLHTHKTCESGSFVKRCFCLSDTSRKGTYKNRNTQTYTNTHSRRRPNPPSRKFIEKGGSGWLQQAGAKKMRRRL